MDTTQTTNNMLVPKSGVFYTLDKDGNQVLRNLKKENMFFNHEDFYRGLFDSYNYLYYENFECYHNEAQGSDYFRRGCKIEEGMKVLDMGANIGFFALSAIQRGATKVYCFEPIRATYQCLMSNCSVFDDTRVETFNFGISNRTGSVKFSIPKDWTHNGGGQISSLTSTDSDFFHHEFCAVVDGEFVFNDSIWGDVDFLKIDIEGAERLVLEQIPDHTLKRLKCIAGEFHCHDDDFQKFQDEFIGRCYNFGFQSFVLYQGDGTLRTVHLWKD